MKHLRTALWTAATFCSGAAAVGSISSMPRPDAVPPPVGSTAFKPDPNLVALGKRVFFDPCLSEPQGTPCTVYHNSGRAFAPTLKGETLYIGVPVGSRPGHVATRNASSLLYLRYIPHRYFFQDDDASFPSPSGSFFADSRADSIPEQIHGSLFNLDEMGNRLTRDLQRKVAGTDFGETFAKQFGANAVHESERPVSALGKALEAYSQSDELVLFTSRFDDFLHKRTLFSAAEIRGLAPFRNPDKDSCVSCHLMVEPSPRPERSLFTDSGYDAITVPRDPLLSANKDARHFDVGLCQTARTLKWPESDRWCDYFRTAGLRNVVVRQTPIHSGVFRMLRDMASSYATYSTDPVQWYPGGKRFNDVPVKCQGNINVDAVSMNHRPGTTPALMEDETNGIVAFLRTLTDARYMALIPDPAADETRSAHTPKVVAKTVALERQSPAGTNTRQQLRRTARRRLTDDGRLNTGHGAFLS